MPFVTTLSVHDLRKLRGSSLRTRCGAHFTAVQDNPNQRSKVLQEGVSQEKTEQQQFFLKGHTNKQHLDKVLRHSLPCNLMSYSLDII